MRNWPSENAILLYFKSISKQNQNWDRLFLRLKYNDSSQCFYFEQVQPTEIYNLGAMSHVKVSIPYLRRLRIIFKK